MQLNETDKMAMKFNRKAREKFGNRVTDFGIENVIGAAQNTKCNNSKCL